MTVKNMQAPFRIELYSNDYESLTNDFKSAGIELRTVHRFSANVAPVVIDVLTVLAVPATVTAVATTVRAWLRRHDGRRVTAKLSAEGAIDVDVSGFDDETAAKLLRTACIELREAARAPESKMEQQM
ncbi:hypothetical protein [Chitinolyticbacter meiyuanensis]|uniref:hypothetical protein n=1 Tax=Chitinolyticbacter meiyuanensis TaxID=682798 RepID=UPI0011E6067B|nr:hypothetical protein [Chitinolyticbacter meiyuanensis]